MAVPDLVSSTVLRPALDLSLFLAALAHTHTTSLFQIL